MKALTTDVSTTPRQAAAVRKTSLWMLVVAIFLTLWAYQFEHHGLWGTLVNYNKTPSLTLTGTRLTPNALDLVIYRPNGPDTYGSFVEKVALVNPTTHHPVAVWGPKQLAGLPSRAIHNTYYFQRITTGPWGLVVPLSAEATVTLPIPAQDAPRLQKLSHVTVVVEDVSGLKWHVSVPAGQ